MGKKSKILKPKQDKSSKFALSASADTEPNFNAEPPSFCLRYVDPEYALSQCTDDDKLAFVERIQKLSTLTWSDIIQADRHGFGREKIAQTAIRRPIPEHITEDMTLIALRFSGLKPMVGYQKQRTFHIIWFDCGFTLYNHG